MTKTQAALLVSLVIFGVSLPAKASAQTKEERVFSVGSISQKTHEEEEIFKPFTDYLARRLKTLGVTRGEVVVHRPSEQSKRSSIVHRESEIQGEVT